MQLAHKEHSVESEQSLMFGAPALTCEVRLAKRQLGCNCVPLFNSHTAILLHSSHCEPGAISMTAAVWLKPAETCTTRQAGDANSSEPLGFHASMLPGLCSGNMAGTCVGLQ